jgi:cation-transporting ATPase 13A3/4/5
MYPKPVDFKFNTDAYRFITALACISVSGLIYTSVTKSLRGIPPSGIALDALDLLTIVVPPALPAAMTVGIMLATRRLKKRQIFCISPRTVNLSGLINCVCFDKTGTLTEDGLDLWGVVPVGSDSALSKFTSPVRPNNLQNLPIKDPLIISMATCHSLTLINQELAGDPLDLKMFESTGWMLEEPQIAEEAKYDMFVPAVVKPPAKTGIPFEVGIVRQFPFSSAIQRMSVIVRPLTASGEEPEELPPFQLLCKGAPEKIASLCKPETIPSEFAETLEQYTEKGYRVLAFACRSLEGFKYLKLQRVSRQELEKDLTLLGFLVMENRLKPPTTSIINELKLANIRTVMVTGKRV